MKFTFLMLAALGAAAQTLEPSPGADPAASPSFVRRAFTIRSEILRETRTVVVALPPSFERTKEPRRYPVAVILDGEFVVSRVAPVAADLIRNGQIPEMVLVGIENIDQFRGRVRDLTPPGLSVSGSSRNEGGDRFLDFIERELLPAMDKQFRTAAPRILIGMSSGGILATWAAASRDTFRLVISLDAPLHLDAHWLPKKLIARAKSSGVPIHYASYTARFNFDADLWKDLQSTARPGWRLQHQHLARETHNSMPLLGAYLGLRFVFEPYSKMSAPEMPTTSILPYYDQLTNVYGAPLEPPRSLIREVVDDLMMEGRGAEARRAFERLSQLYGPSPDASALSARIAEVEKRPPPAETVESLLNQPFPTPEQAREYLGDWKGEDWMNPEARNTAHIRIRVENGRVVGESFDYPPGMKPIRRPIQLLKVGKDTLTFGYMNGMRPRGMILWELKRNGEYFEGRMRWGGVAFRMEDGREPPVIHMRLRKVTAQ